MDVQLRTGLGRSASLCSTGRDRNLRRHRHDRFGASRGGASVPHLSPHGHLVGGRGQGLPTRARLEYFSLAGVVAKADRWLVELQLANALDGDGGNTRAALLLDFLFFLVLIEASIECPSADSKDLGGFFSIVVRQLERFFDRPSFNHTERLPHE